MSNNDEKLISQLILETCIDGDTKDQSNVFGDLRSYFEKRLNEVDFISLEDYIIQNNLNFSNLDFLNQSKCYRLSYSDTVIDFPSNWSVFKNIKSEEIQFLDQSLDQDYLLDIFSEVTGTYFNLAFIRENESVKIIFLKEEESLGHVKWMRNYFESKSKYSERAKAA